MRLPLVVRRASSFEHHPHWLRRIPLVALALAFAPLATAELEPLPRGDEVDPFTFAAKVRARGDQPILDALDEPERHGRAALRRAIRAAPELRTPAAALRPLVEIAASREPFDSIAAMRVVFAIVRALPGDAVERFELDPSELEVVVEKLSRLAADENALPDIALMAGVAAAELGDLLS